MTLFFPRLFIPPTFEYFFKEWDYWVKYLLSFVAVRSSHSSLEQFGSHAAASEGYLWPVYTDLYLLEGRRTIPSGCLVGGVEV